MPQQLVTSQETLDRLTLALDSGAFVDVRRMLNGLPPAGCGRSCDHHRGPRGRRRRRHPAAVTREGDARGPGLDGPPGPRPPRAGNALPGGCGRWSDEHRHHHHSCAAYAGRGTALPAPPRGNPGDDRQPDRCEPQRPVHRPAAAAHPAGRRPVGISARDDGYRRRSDTGQSAR